MDDVRLKLVNQLAHLARRAERVVPLNHTHINAALARLICKRTGAE